MNKQTFLVEIETLSSNLSSDQQTLVAKMMDAFAPYENQFGKGEFFVKKVKENNADNPRHSFSIGVKERPLNFVGFTLNLDTNEIQQVTSELVERILELPPLVAPDGSVIQYLPQTFISSKQASIIVF